MRLYYVVSVESGKGDRTVEIQANLIDMMGDRQPAYIEAKRFLPMLENMLKRSPSYTLTL